MTRLFGLFLMLLLAAPVAAESAPTSTAAHVPLLWKVDGGAHAVYLLGSFHMLKPDDYPLADEVEAAFADSGTVLFELPPEDLESADAVVLMFREALYRDGRTLRDDLSPDLWARFEAYMQSGSSSHTLIVLERLKPWMVAMMINLDEVQRVGMQPELGMDQYFVGQAKTTGKSVGGLESMQDQISVMSKMSVAEQQQMLSEALDLMDEGSDALERLHTLWRNGDADALWSEMSAPMREEYPDLYQRINIDRNKAWLPQIEHRLHVAEHDTLVVVGAMHLVGEDGLVALLQAKGYSVERVCSSCTPAD